MRIYFDADPPAYPAVDDLAPTSAPVAARPARRKRQGLRNWQKFVLCYVPIRAAGVWLLYQIGGAATALVGLAIWLATMLIILTLAGASGQL